MKHVNLYLLNTAVIIGLMGFDCLNAILEATMTEDEKLDLVNKGCVDACKRVHNRKWYGTYCTREGVAPNSCCDCDPNVKIIIAHNDHAVNCAEACGSSFAARPNTSSNDCDCYAMV